MKQISVIVPLGKGRDADAVRSIEKFGNRVQLIVERGGNPSRNRNRGISKAIHPYIAFINGHTILPDNWINEIDSFFKRYPSIDIVGGPQLNAPDANLFERASGYALGSIFAAGSLSTRYHRKGLILNASERQLTSANLICKRHVLKTIKFNEKLEKIPDS